MKTIKQQLLELGMREHEIDTHESDLYVLVNDISKQWVEGYEFKNLVTTFRSEIDNELWFEIPFGYANEHYLYTKPATEIKFHKLDEKPTLLKEFKEYQYELVEMLILKIFNTNNVAYTSSSNYAAFWNNENPTNNKARYIALHGLTLRAITLDVNENLIAVYENHDENDFYYSVTFDI